MKRKLPTRLELHRLKRHHNGGKGQLLHMFELDDAERFLISRDFFQAVWVDGQRQNPYKILAEVLASWGVMCPHPEEQWDYGSRWVACRGCGTILGPYSQTEPARCSRSRKMWSG